MKKPKPSYWKTLVHPKKEMQLLLQNDHYFQRSFFYISLPIFGYLLVYIFLTSAHGAPSVFTPWLNIPKDNYYAVNRFLLAPSILMGWVVAVSFIQIMAGFLHGRGTFEQTLSVLALSISLAMWGSLIHDLPMSFLSAIGIINANEHEIAMNEPTFYRTLLWISYTIYTLLFLILFPLTVKVVHRLNTIQNITVGVVAFFLFQSIFLLFNR
ncbi:MAG TPA: Yip1 family protein [Saprospiraceae bacterium]|nr:Yip1 family protein [Saprospiraceae bacterium]